MTMTTSMTRTKVRALRQEQNAPHFLPGITWQGLKGMLQTSFVTLDRIFFENYFCFLDTKKVASLKILFSPFGSKLQTKYEF